MKKKIILILIASVFCLFCLTSCGTGLDNLAESETVASNDNSLNSAATIDYNYSSFFTKLSRRNTYNVYSVCYENADGTITEIVEMGTSEKDFVIRDGRIFFADGQSIISVDLSGGDEKRFWVPEYNFVNFSCSDGDWLYFTVDILCTESDTMPIMIDTVRVKTDFSEYERS